MGPPPIVPGPPHVLTRQQTRERTARALATSAHTSCERRRQELLDYVVRINMGIARAVVSRYANHGVETDDLLEVAHAALHRAARDFGPGRHAGFVSHAVITVRGELEKHLRDRVWTVPSPRRQEPDGLSDSG